MHDNRATRSHTRWWLVAALVAVIGTAALSACGGSGPAAADEGTEASREDAMLAYAQCLREHGIDVKDPAGGGMSVSIGPGEEAKMKAAEKACRGKMPQGMGEAPSPEEQQQALDDALKYARCMRSHGIPMPDPKASPDGRGIQIEGPRGGAGPSTERFKAAEKACVGNLDGKRGADGPVLSEKSR